MKTKFLPVAAFVLAVAGAFAFSKAPQSQGKSSEIPGFYKDGANCVDANEMCTEEVTSEPCSTLSHPALYKYVGPTNCPNQLWRIE